MKKIFFIAIAILLIVTALIALWPSKTIKIGFTGDISTGISQIGIEARNACQLYIDELNEAGGIDNRAVELVVLDDQNTVEAFQENMQYFREHDIQYVIGPITSNLAQAVDEERQDIIILSASVSSTILSNQDDYFFRTTASTTLQPAYLIEYLSEYDPLPSVSIVYDVRNQIYVDEFRAYFETNYQGEVVFQCEAGHETFDAEQMAQCLKDKDADLILYIAPALVAANIAQYIHVMDYHPEQFGVMWGMTDELLVAGGDAVEGMKFVYYKYESEDPHYNEAFRASYMELFGVEPSFISGFYYEGISFLCHAIDVASSDRIEDVKAALLSIEYQSLSDPIHLNEYGDRVLQGSINIVVDGNIVDYEHME